MDVRLEVVVVPAPDRYAQYLVDERNGQVAGT